MGMTQDPTQGGLSTEKVAELEHKLADAAAEVARVQAQLSQAQHAGDPPPPAGVPLSTTPPPGAGAPGTTIPSVPYAGMVSPHTITINGQQVLPGSGNLLQMLSQLGQSGGVPVVMVNGQQVSGGSVADVSKYLTPEVTQRIQSSLSALGLDHGLGAMFGQTGVAGPPPSPISVAPLAEPPRSVPLTFRLATFDLNVWEIFGILIGAVAPMAVWMTSDDALAGALVAGVLVIAFFRVRKYLRRIRILKWGKVATVTNSDEISRGTYYSGTTYQNMFMRQASGWDITSRLYSGPGSTTVVQYSLDGQNGSLKVRGLPYTNGVVLADSRKPTRAMVVSQFPYSVKPDESGRYVGTLSAWRWGGIIATLVFEATLVFVAVEAVLDTWVNR
jgi:hypothetical protein